MMSLEERDRQRMERIKQMEASQPWLEQYHDDMFCCV